MSSFVVPRRVATAKRCPSRGTRAAIPLKLCFELTLHLAVDFVCCASYAYRPSLLPRMDRTGNEGNHAMSVRAIRQEGSGDGATYVLTIFNQARPSKDVSTNLESYIERWQVIPSNLKKGTGCVCIENCGPNDSKTKCLRINRYHITNPAPGFHPRPLERFGDFHAFNKK